MGFLDSGSSKPVQQPTNLWGPGTQINLNAKPTETYVYQPDNTLYQGPPGAAPKSAAEYSWDNAHMPNTAATAQAAPSTVEDNYGYARMLSANPADAPGASAAYFTPGKIYNDVYKGMDVGSFTQDQGSFALGGNSAENDYVSHAMGNAMGYQNAIAASNAKIGNSVDDLKYAGQQNLGNEKSYLTKADNQKLDSVSLAQLNQGQPSYQDYLNAMKKGTASADAQQAMVGRLTNEYANPSTTAAQMQMRAATDQNLQSNLALAHSGNNAGAMARALTANAGAQQQAAAQAAQLQAQEMQSLRGNIGSIGASATGAYSNLANLGAQTAQQGAQSYQAAERANADRLAQNRSFYSGLGGQYGTLAGQQLAQQNNYVSGLQTQNNALTNQQSYFTQLAQANTGNKQALNAANNSEFVRQQNERYNMTIADANARQGGNSQSATMQQAQNNADRARGDQQFGTALQVGATVMGPIGSTIFKGGGNAIKSSGDQANAEKSDAPSDSMY